MARVPWKCRTPPPARPAQAKSRPDPAAAPRAASQVDSPRAAGRAAAWADPTDILRSDRSVETLLPESRRSPDLDGGDPATAAGSPLCAGIRMQLARQVPPQAEELDKCPHDDG